MAQRYAVIHSANWTDKVSGRIIDRPSSYGNTALGPNASDEIFRSLGLWPVVVDDPGPSSQWEERAGVTHTVNSTDEIVTETVQYALVALEQRQSAMQQQARQQYQASLERGFSYDGGQWPATGPKRNRVTELVASINAGKGLPQSKAALTFRDLSGTTHDLSATGIIELGAAGSDLVDAADDNLESLIGQIQAAMSHADLDAINVSAGWPN